MKVFVVMNCYEYGEVRTWAAYSSEADAHAEAARAEAEDRRTVRDVYEAFWVEEVELDPSEVPPAQATAEPSTGAERDTGETP